MDAPPIKLAVVPDRTLELLDGILGDIADALESMEFAIEHGTPVPLNLVGPMKSLTCRARGLVLEDRDTGGKAWELLDKAINR